MCCLILAAWYSSQVSTASALSCCIACMMLPSLTLQRPRKTDSATTVSATAWFSHLREESAGRSVDIGVRIKLAHG